MAIIFAPQVPLSIALLLIAAIPLPCLASGAGEERWILIDTGALTLTLMHDDKPQRTYGNIAIGSNGAARDKAVRDEKTPLGEYRIDAIRPSERFVWFLSLDYPSSADAERALHAGRIDGAQYRAIETARARGARIPDNTALGGNIGIHGIGAGNVEIHRYVNWTDGCIALTNEQLEELLGAVAVGNRVLIR